MAGFKRWNILSCVIKNKNRVLLKSKFKIGVSENEQTKNKKNKKEESPGLINQVGFNHPSNHPSCTNEKQIFPGDKSERGQRYIYMIIYFYKKLPIKVAAWIFTHGSLYFLQ